MAVSPLLAIILLLSCGDSQGPDWTPSTDSTTYVYRIPDQVGGDWPTASLESVGMDPAPFMELMNRLRRTRDHLVHGILVVKDGRLVFEEYFPGNRWISPGVYEDTVFTRETRHYQASVTKSVTAALVGIAHDAGLLELSDPVLSYFPGLSHLAGGGRDAITLEHLIAMRSGLPWDESSVSYSNPANDITQLFYNPDPIGYILGKEMDAPAGTLFHYNSGCTNVLGKVVDLVTGRRLDTFSVEALFGPLGITDASWDLIRNDLVFASGGLHMRPRDMARIGELYLRGGQWGGVQVLSEAWVAATRVPRSHVSYGWADGYGYGWWTRTYATGWGPVETYFAAGWGEQQIIVVPSLDLVAVFTGGAYDSAPYLSPGQMMALFVLPSAMGG